MTKSKISTGLAAVILVGSLFVGWQTMLIVTVLLFALCDVDEKVKSIAIKVITFYIGLTLVIMAWDLIYDGVDLIFTSIDKIVATINSYLDYGKQIDIEKLQAYVIIPAGNLLKIADNIADYLFVFVKFSFIISLFAGKNQKDNLITNKINGFVSKVLAFINSFEMPVNNVNAGMQTQAPVQNQVQEQVQASVQTATQDNMPNNNQNLNV